MLSLFDLGNDVLNLIIAQADASSYRALALSCSHLAHLCRQSVEKKKMETRTYQEKVNRKKKRKVCYYTLPNGQKHGPYKVFIKDHPFLSCSYKDGLLHGEMKKLFSNGCLRLQCYYKSGKLHGDYVKVYPSAVKEIYKYRHGKYHGKYKRYSRGEIIEEGEYRFGLLLWQVLISPLYVERYNYRKGKKHGYYFKYRRDDKKVLIEGYYKHGKKWGPWKNHEENSIVYYVNGQKEGIYRRYYYGSNKICKKETYVRNKKHGKSIRYNEDRSINKECFYRHGLKEGWFREYYSNGKIWIACRYRQDKLHGKYQRYNRDDELLVSEYYKRGYLNGNSYRYFEKDAEQYHDGKRIHYVKYYFCHGLKRHEQYWYIDGTCSDVIPSYF